MKQKYVTEYQMTLDLYVICHISLDYVIIHLMCKVQRTVKISKMCGSQSKNKVRFSPFLPRNVIWTGGIPLTAAADAQNYLSEVNRQKCLE